MKLHTMTKKEQYALITGASSGIGSACAQALARHGISVIVTGRSRTALAELVKTTGGRMIVADMRDESQIETIFSKVGERIDILINSAGIAPRAPLLDGSPERFREMLAVNVFALTRCCQLALTKFDPVAGGHIVNISSMSGHRVPLSGGFHTVTKYAVRAITESLRYELKASKNPTRIATISPGFVDTPQLRHYFEGSEHELLALRQRLRMLKPADIAASVLHILESPEYVEIGDIQLRSTDQTM